MQAEASRAVLIHPPLGQNARRAVLLGCISAGMPHSV
jgi:hypothetical protein